MVGCWLFVVVVLLYCCYEFFCFVCGYRLILIGVWWLIFLILVILVMAMSLDL